MNTFLAVISILHGTIELQSGPMYRDDCRADLVRQMEIVISDDDPTNDALCADSERIARMAKDGWEIIRLK